jgi:hypothetical protein
MSQVLFRRRSDALDNLPRSCVSAQFHHDFSCDKGLNKPIGAIQILAFHAFVCEHK